MMQTSATDEIANGTDRQLLFEALYLRVFPKVAAFISKRNGSLDDAKDVFQDALVIFCEKHTAAGFDIHTSEEAYLLGIARHLWYRKFGNDVAHFLPIDDEGIDAGKEPSIDTGKLLSLLEQTGKKCLRLLHAFYYGAQPLRQVASAFGYSSERSATVQKYKCLEKIRDTIKKRSITYAHFLE